MSLPDLAEFEEKLGISFRDKRLLERAFTHHSWCPETAQVDSYDTLEFLGDAILGAHVVDYIYRSSPGASEGEMTALKSEAISRRTLAEIGRRLGLLDYVRVNVLSLRTFNERSKDSLAADVLEALVGALYLDQGPEAARVFIAREILPAVEQVRGLLHEKNPKGRLQQVILRRRGVLPRYRLLGQSGSSSDPEYTVGVYVGQDLLATGTASSMKEAGRLAACEALHLLAKTGAPALDASPEQILSEGSHAPDVLADA